MMTLVIVKKTVKTRDKNDPEDSRQKHTHTAEIHRFMYTPSHVDDHNTHTTLEASGCHGILPASGLNRIDSEPGL